VAQAVKPAEPRFISAFFSFPGDSYDRAVRDERESDRIKGYIENNPVKSRTRGQRGRLSLVERGKKSRDESRLGRLDSLRHA
jgi:hydroxypyruvate isomerase